MKQHEKILHIMGSGRKSQAWYAPPDFMDPALDDLFVGYEASARLSELASRYPDMFESTRFDKYLHRRIKWEEIDEWLPQLPKNLREIVSKYA